MHAGSCLMQAGGFGLQPRVGVRYEQGRHNLWSVLVGRPPHRQVEIELAPAWPVGVYGWNTHKDITEAIETGLTLSGHVVPMSGPSYAEHQEKPQGGVVAYSITAPPDTFPDGRRDDTWRGPVANWTHIANAMDSLVNQLT